ncbi:F0F1 ATP synthase subunit gamma, partial [Synechocystis salina LEGE 06155]|nr:F0F1 ATP synthase subunit gamma [Synechocystis salina LEGE 06155]
QGMCGRFNEQMALYVIRHLQHSPFAADARRLLVVGTRIAGLLEAQGHTIDRCLSVPNALGQVTQQVQNIVLQLERWWREQQVDRIWVFYNRPQRS